jgi:hypothetical protein
MTFLHQFEADVRKATKDHQRALVVEVLRGRAGELTLGDIRKLLQSPLGKGLDDVKVASLFGAHAGKPSDGGKAAKAKPSSARAKPRDVKEAKPTPADKKSTKTPAAKPKTRKRHGKRLVSQETLDVVKQAFVDAAGRTLDTSELVATTKLHRRTVLNAVRQLRDAGWIEVSGRASKPKPSAPKAASPASTTPTEDDKLDAAVVSALSAAREPTTSTVLVKTTGAPLMRVRAALQRLVGRGQVTRTGIARFTRYALAVPAL